MDLQLCLRLNLIHRRIVVGLDDPDLHTPRDDMGGPGSQRECPECMDLDQEFPLLTQGTAAAAFEILEVSNSSRV